MQPTPGVGIVFVAIVFCGYLSASFSWGRHRSSEHDAVRQAAFTAATRPSTAKMVGSRGSYPTACWASPA
jgi:hypothetical protein